MVNIELLKSREPCDLRHVKPCEYLCLFAGVNLQSTQLSTIHSYLYSTCIKFGCKTFRFGKQKECAGLLPSSGCGVSSLSVRRLFLIKIHTEPDLNNWKYFYSFF